MEKIQAQLQQHSEEFTKLQQDLQAAILSLRQLESQKTENVNVKKEFDKLKDGEDVYKLVGPVLLKQDKADAEATVKGRLDFIGTEMTRVEGQITDVKRKLEEKKAQIIQLQSGAQATAQAAQGAGKTKAVAS